jgi:ribosome-associated protein
VSKPRRPARPDPATAVPELEPWRGPSRSQEKREALEITALGHKLTELSDRELSVLGLDGEVLAAVVECRRLSKNARSRQLKLIGKLMRGRELDKLREGLGLVQGKRSAERAREQGLEARRRALVEGGDAALEDVLRAHPNADRQKLRQLVRDARRTPASPPQVKAFRQLLRELRLLAEADADAGAGDESGEVGED